MKTPVQLNPGMAITVGKAVVRFDRVTHGRLIHVTVEHPPKTKVCEFHDRNNQPSSPK